MARRSQSNLYFALVFLDHRRRDAIRDVYRFLRAADDVADAPGDAAENIHQLAEWRAQLEAIYTGGATHPYAKRLARVVRRYDLSREHFETALGGLEDDVRTARLSSWPEVEAYCERVASSLAYLCLEILGVAGMAERRYAHDVAIGIQIANILRDIAEDAQRDHIYLPMDELCAAGVAEADILHMRMSPALAGVCRHQAARARALILGARARLDAAAQRRMLIPEIWADVYLALLDELESVGFDVFDHRPYLHRRRKLRLALQRSAVSIPRAWAARFFPPGQRMW